MIKASEIMDFIKEPSKDLSGLKESLDEKDFVKQKIENADFNQSPWNKRFELFRNHNKLLRPPKQNRDYQNEKNILWLVQKVDQELLSAYYQKEDARFKASFYNRLNNTIFSLLSSSKYKSGIPLHTYKSVAEIIQFARGVDESKKRNDTIQDIANKTHSLDARIYQIYKNLLMEDGIHIWKFENELKNTIKLDDLDSDIIQYKYRNEILKILNTENKNPLTLYHDSNKCMWIAKFMKNFEQCYEILSGRFYFDENNANSIYAAIDKIRKIIERATLKNDIMKIRTILRRISIKYSEESRKYELIDL